MGFYVIDHDFYNNSFVLDTSDNVCEYVESGKLVKYLKMGIQINGAILDMGTLVVVNKQPAIRELSIPSMKNGVSLVVDRITISASRYCSHIVYRGYLLVIGRASLESTEFCSRVNMEKVEEFGYVCIADVSSDEVGRNIRKFASEKVDFELFDVEKDLSTTFNCTFNAPLFAFPDWGKFLGNFTYATNVGSDTTPVRLGDVLYRVFRNGYIRRDT